MQICRRGLICICESFLWGGDIMHISPVRRCFSLNRDIFSVAKLKYSFWSAAGGASYYVAFSHTLTWVEKYINICHESCFESVLTLFLLGIGECYFVTVDCDSLFWTYLYFYVVWWTETSGEAFSRYYLSPLLNIQIWCAFFLICWCLVSVWHIEGNLFLRTGRNLIYEYSLWTFILVFPLFPFYSKAVGF